MDHSGAPGARDRTHQPAGHDPVASAASVRVTATGSRGREVPVTLYGEGPPLVLVPGMDGTGLLFYRQIPLLAPRYRVATFPLRDDAREMRIHSQDLAGVIQSFSAGPAIVVGESFGGTVALSTALARPELVAELVVLNSFPFFRPQLRLRLAMTWLRLVPWKAMTLVRRLTAFRMHSRYTHRREIRRFLQLTRNTTREGYLNRLRVLTCYDIRDRLADIRAPTLLLAAARDHLVPSVQQAAHMAAHMPTAELRVLEGHGHICMIAPDFDLARLISEWRTAPSG